jgi:hypothetical protein
MNNVGNLEGNMHNERQGCPSTFSFRKKDNEKMPKHILQCGGIFGVRTGCPSGRSGTAPNNVVVRVD